MGKMWLKPYCTRINRAESFPFPAAICWAGNGCALPEASVTL